MTGQDAPGARRPTAGISSRRALLGKLAALGAGVAAAPRAVASFLGKEPARFELARFSADVTPPLGHPCMGGGIAPAARVEDPLEIHGIVLLGAGEPLVIAAIDWCEIRNDAYAAWRQGLAVAAGTKPERVLLSCVHQHDAPIADLTAQRLLEWSGARGAICDLAFHGRAVEAAARALHASLVVRRPVTHVGTGSAAVKDVASNRRFVDDAGRVSFGRTSSTRTEAARAADGGLIDPVLRSLSFWEEDRPLAVLSSYATHPMSYYGQGGVSADFVGAARRRRQAELPEALQIYVSGASGNVTAGKYNDGAPENRPVLAGRIHAAMQSAWASTVRQELRSIELKVATVQLEPRAGNGFDVVDLEQRLDSDESPFGQCLAALGLSWRSRAYGGAQIEVPAIHLGPVVYLLLPGEAYVEYQLHAQAVRPDLFVVTAGYGECATGYIPTEKAREERDWNLGEWCWVAPGAERPLREAIGRALAR